MKTLYPNIALEELCGLFGVSRQAYYKHQLRRGEQSHKESIVIEMVGQVRAYLPKAGARKLYHLLSQDLKTLNVGRDMLFTILSTNNLLIRNKKRKVRTTQSWHSFYKYPNLIRELEQIKLPNHVWVSDITYIPTGQSFCYLSLITDAYSKKIVGFHLSKTLKATGSIQALLAAIDQWGQCTSELIHHSDRGIQYCCYEYINILKAYNIHISMTENGDPYENAIAERVNGILKSEFLDTEYESFGQAKQAVSKAVHMYNTKRPHLSCDMLTPLQAHLCQGELKKHWKNYYKQKIDVNLYQD